MITRAFATGASVHSTPDAFRILARHKRKVVLFFCATLAAVVGVLVVLPRNYSSDSSEARLYVRLGKEGASLHSTATPGQLVAVSGSRESEINSELEVLRSPVLLQDLEDAVEHLGPKRIPGGSAGRAKT